MKSLILAAALLCALNANAQLRAALDNGAQILCAHRGGMYANYAENSLNTLKYLERGFKGQWVMAEIDIRKSKDGTLFLMHDNTLERTTNGKGNIEDASDNYLKSLKLKNGKGEVLDERIPTFAELLDFIYRRRIYLMLDVKIDDWKAILDLVKEKNLVDRCVVLTFNPENTKKVIELSPKILVSTLAKDFEPFKENENAMVYISADQEYEYQKFYTVTDASEATRNNSSPYSTKYYKDVVGNVSIFVTDLPLEVKALLK